MKRKTVRRTAAWLAVVLWMGVIFAFSAQPASESALMSDPFTDAWIALFHPEYDALSPKEQFDVREAASFIVRKIAHGTIYAVLGALLTVALSTVLPPGKAGAAALPIAALYAVSDEIHQIFVSGRAGQLRDVLIDTGGALAGILLTAAALLVLWAVRNEKKEKGREESE